MEIKVNKYSRFDYQNNPKKADLLKLLLESQYANSDFLTEDTNSIKYMDVEITSGNNVSKYEVHLNMANIKNATNFIPDILNSEEKKKNLDIEKQPVFLINNPKDPYGFQFPFDHLDDVIEYLVLLEKGEVPVV